MIRDLRSLSPPKYNRLNITKASDAYPIPQNLGRIAYPTSAAAPSCERRGMPITPIISPPSSFSFEVGLGVEVEVDIEVEVEFLSIIA
jgi:hypothetical protein